MTATFNIENSVAFVTGTNKKNGIGRAVLQALLENGAKKVYATARDASQIDDLVAEHNGNVVAVSLDVTDSDAITALPSQYPDVTLVVNNAGYFGSGSSLDNLEGALKEIQVNYVAPLAIVQGFAQLWKKTITPNEVEGTNQEHGAVTRAATAVVNISSIAALINFPVGATYSASKAAEHSLTQAQRRDLSKYSLVVGVYPGPIETDMAKGLPFDDMAPPSAVANAVVEALTKGTEDVFPDMMSQQMYQGWKADAKAMEVQMLKSAAA